MPRPSPVWSRWPNPDRAGPGSPSRPAAGNGAILPRGRRKAAVEAATPGRARLPFAPGCRERGNPPPRQEESCREGRATGRGPAPLRARPQGTGQSSPAAGGKLPWRPRYRAGPGSPSRPAAGERGNPPPRQEESCRGGPQPRAGPGSPSRLAAKNRAILPRGRRKAAVGAALPGGARRLHRNKKTELSADSSVFLLSLGYCGMYWLMMALTASSSSWAIMMT